ncbi:MAG: hypothetical protein HYS73_01200 [Parcubacteria group bacterium]|nr:hypothetical protein [Parcubacteria group bacterium]
MKVKSKKIFTYLLFFWLLPLFFTYLLLWTQESPFLVGKTADDQVKVTINTEEINKPDIRKKILELFQIPYSINSVNFCIENRSKVIENGESEALDGGFTILDISGKELISHTDIAGGKEVCKTLSMSSPIEEFIIKGSGDAHYSPKYFKIFPDGAVGVSFQPIFNLAPTKAFPFSEDRVLYSIAAFIIIWGVLLIVLQVLLTIPRQIFEKHKEKNEESTKKDMTPNFNVEKNLLKKLFF